VDEVENNNLPLCRGLLQYVLVMPRTMLPCPHIAPRRGGSRNIEGVYITCRHVGNNFVVVRRLPKAVVRDPSARSAEIFFTFIFQLSWLALVAPSWFALHC